MQYPFGYIATIKPQILLVSIGYFLQTYMHTVHLIITYQV